MVGFSEFNLKYTSRSLNGVVKEVVIRPNTEYAFDYNTGILAPIVDLVKTGDNEFTLTINTGNRVNFPDFDKYTILNGVTGATLIIDGSSRFTDVEENITNSIFNHFSNLVINNPHADLTVKVKQGETRVINVKGIKSDGYYTTSRLYDNRSEGGIGSFDYGDGGFYFERL